MEEVTAFQMYQKQIKKKRKAPPEHTEEPNKVTSPSKKIKSLVKCKTVKKKNTKILSKKLEMVAEVHSADESSDEEVPTLVPIADFKDIDPTNEPKSEGPKKLKKVKSNAIATNRNITNGNPKKKPESTKPKGLVFSEVWKLNPVMQGLTIFKWLIDPICPREFFEKYWEKEVLHVKRSNREHFDDVFCSEHLDYMLRDYPVHFTRNIDVVTYQNGKKEVVDEEGRALPAKVWDYYNNGYSIRILNPQSYDNNVHLLISSLQEYFGGMVGTNAYLTPPHSQGFAPHFDDIEAFIVQLEGSKYWKLYKPREEDVLARDSSQNFKAEDLGAPFMEVKLEAGDLLYFPRGTIHEGHTEEEHSLHITVSMYQHTAYIDLLEQLLPAALKKASENLEFRRGLPLNYLKHLGVVNKNDQSNNRKILIDKIKSLVDTLGNYIDVDSAADNLGRKFMHDAMPPRYSVEEFQHSCKIDGDYLKDGKVLNRVEINPYIKIRLLRYYAVRVVQESETTSKLYFCTDNANTYHGEEEQWLEIDNSLVPGIEMLQNQYPNFVVADSLPIKDEAAKLGLVSSLWEHGLVVTDAPLPLCDSDSESGDSNSSDEANDSTGSGN